MKNEIKIPTLTAEDIECRVQSVTSGAKVGAILLLYKDARVDMRILDDVYGSNNWQRTHEVINGNLFCSIDIWDDEKQAWIRKQDVGVESNAEAKKGEASDAFKRAGTTVGIGRELYTAPFIYVVLNESDYDKDNNGKYKIKSSVKFNVSHVAYNDRREISELTITDNKGAVRYTYKEANKPPATANSAAAEPKNDAPAYLCADCGKPFAECAIQGRIWTDQQQYDHSCAMNKDGKARCGKCRKKLDAKETESSNSEAAAS